MPAVESVASAVNLTKVLYPDSVSIPIYKTSKFVGTMNKDNEFYGQGAKFVVVSIAPGAGGSANIASAIANQGSTQEIKFTLGRKKLYEVGSIDGELIAAGRNSKGAIVDIVKHAMKRATDAYARSEARAAWGNGGGSRGQVASTSNVATATITLTNRADVAGFFKGMFVQTAADDGVSGSAGTRGGGVQAQLGSIQRLTAGTATLTLASGLWNQFPGITAGTDFIFRSGDYQGYPNGIQGWAPTTDPGGGDSFLGINRSTSGDLNYLSGWRVPSTGQPKQQSLIDAAAEAHLSGLSVNTVFMNPLDLRDAFKEQSTYKTVDVKTDIPEVGYKGIELQAAVGDMSVLSETDVPKGFAWMIDPGTWTRRSAGDVPMLLDYDGIKMFLRNPSGDDYQFRFGGYFNYENAEPVQAVVVAF